MQVHGTISGSIGVSGGITGSLSPPTTLTGSLIFATGGIPVDIYSGPYEVTPKAWNDQTLETEGLLMTDDVTVFKVPYYETSNVFDGKTIFIAEDTNG